MILWTIQRYQVWEILQNVKTLRANPASIEADEMADSFTPAYKWLVEQMEKRIGPKPAGVEFPLWAWYQWKNDRHRKPDLRSSRHLPKRQKGVRIEFEIDDRQVLLSDFHLWHYALNYWYLPRNEQDDLSFEAKLEALGLSFYEMKPLPDSAYHQQILDSWLRIFDLDWRDGEQYINADQKENKSIQATFWELPITNVRKVTVFTSR